MGRVVDWDGEELGFVERSGVDDLHDRAVLDGRERASSQLFLPRREMRTIDSRTHLGEGE